MFKKTKDPRHIRLRRYYIQKLFPKRQGTHKVAFSVALGIFIGIWPTIGIALLLTVAACALFKVPKMPGVISSFISNPYTIFLFFYPAGYKLGLWILQPPKIKFDFLGEMERVSWGNLVQIMSRVWNEGNDHLMAFLLGITIISFVFAVAGYVLTTLVVEYRKKRHREKDNQKLAKTLREN